MFVPLLFRIWARKNSLASQTEAETRDMLRRRTERPGRDAEKAAERERERRCKEKERALARARARAHTHTHTHTEERETTHEQWSAQRQACWCTWRMISTSTATGTTRGAHLRNRLHKLESVVRLAHDLLDEPPPSALPLSPRGADSDADVEVDAAAAAATSSGSALLFWGLLSALGTDRFLGVRSLGSGVSLIPQSLELYV